MAQGQLARQDGQNGPIGQRVFRLSQGLARKLYEGGYAGVNWPKEYGGRAAPRSSSKPYSRKSWPWPTRRNAWAPLAKDWSDPRSSPSERRSKRNATCRPSSRARMFGARAFPSRTPAAIWLPWKPKAWPEGDDFIINGQKIWTSYAHIADQCLLVVRTDPSAAKHKGLTSLLVDMKTPGITVRPLRMMSGDSPGFNEMFFTNVRVSVKHSNT